MLTAVDTGPDVLLRRDGLEPGLFEQLANRRLLR